MKERRGGGKEKKEGGINQNRGEIGIICEGLSN